MGCSGSTVVVTLRHAVAHWVVVAYRVVVALWTVIAHRAVDSRRIVVLTQLW
jgi:hypothetical protein